MGILLPLMSSNFIPLGLFLSIWLNWLAIHSVMGRAVHVKWFIIWPMLRLMKYHPICELLVVCNIMECNYMIPMDLSCS